MKTENIAITELRHAEYDPRELSKRDIDETSKQLTGFGIVEPAVINCRKGRKNTIIYGHKYIAAAGKLGFDTYPCVLVDLDLKKEKELNVRMYKNVGRYDIKKLLSNFTTMELVEVGWDDEELNSMSAAINKPMPANSNKIAYYYELIFDTGAELGRFKTALARITSQLKRTEQTADLIEYLQ